MVFSSRQSNLILIACDALVAPCRCASWLAAISCQACPTLASRRRTRPSRSTGTLSRQVLGGLHVCTHHLRVVLSSLCQDWHAIHVVQVIKALRFSGVNVPRDYEQRFQRTMWVFRHQVRLGRLLWYRRFCCDSDCVVLLRFLLTQAWPSLFAEGVLSRRWGAGACTAAAPRRPGCCQRGCHVCDT